MFVPHEYKGTIWVVTGDRVDHLIKNEYTGKRSFVALSSFVKRTKKKSQVMPFVQYEADDMPLQTFTPMDLLQLGVLKHNYTNEKRNFRGELFSHDRGGIRY
jgi:hypothetical protein